VFFYHLCRERRRHTLEQYAQLNAQNNFVTHQMHGMQITPRTEAEYYEQQQSLLAQGIDICKMIEDNS
jgi:hypothetical protein